MKDRASCDIHLVMMVRLDQFIRASITSSIFSSFSQFFLRTQELPFLWVTVVESSETSWFLDARWTNLILEVLQTQY